MPDDIEIQIDHMTVNLPAGSVPNEDAIKRIVADVVRQVVKKAEK